MAKIDNIIFCQKATVVGESINADGIMPVINPEYIPGLFTFSIVITALDVSLEENHNLEILFLDGSGNEVVRIDTPVPSARPSSSNNLPSEYTGINITMDWNNVNLKVSGLYKLCVRLDADEFVEKEIYVKGKNE